MTVILRLGTALGIRTEVITLTGVVNEEEMLNQAQDHQLIIQDKMRMVGR